MVPYEAFLSGQAGGDDDRRRRAARGRADRETGVVVAPDAPSIARALRVPRRARRRGDGVGARGQGVAERVTWDACVDALLVVKVAYYSPLPPSRSGIADYSALLLPALRERVDVVVAEPGKRAPAADVALYHVGNDPDAHGWIVDALREAPGRRRAARVRAAPPDRRDHDRPRRRPRLPRRDGARARRRRAGCSASACSTTCCRCSGRRSPSGSRSSGTVLDRRTRADRPLATTSASAPRRRVRRAALAHPASRLADARRSCRRPTSRATR